jgi:uncharacterized repeat protein (TIGR03803 family)
VRVPRGAFNNTIARLRRNPVGKIRFARIGLIILLFCTAAAVASPAQVFTSLYSFCSQSGCSDGGKPLYGSLVQGPDGNFYGTTYLGGTANGGTIFKMTPAGARTTLYNFCSQTGCTDGTAPYAGLALGSDGNFYGTTSSGGAGNLGVVFKITPGGAYTTLYSFCSQSGCPDGNAPYAPLIRATDGNFYGTTYTGGSNNQGTAFKITPSGALTTLHSFDGSHGRKPRGALAQGTDGNFYGVTEQGGSNGFGTVFKMTPQGTLTTLYSFCNQGGCPDGDEPYAGLVQGSDGNFYGTTSGGGTNPDNNPDGTVFKITPSGQLTTIYNFCSVQGCADGVAPLAGLIRASDGNFYGTTSGGGLAGQGIVFRLTPAGTLSTLHAFCSAQNCSDGSTPEGGVIQGSDGNFYGQTYGGGANFEGTVYQLARMQLVAVPPCRLIDTRLPNGEFGGPALQGNTVRSFTIPDNRNCNIPSTAAAYSLNVTVVPHSTLGYLTVWPTGAGRPQVSTLNSYDGRIKANASIVPSGTGGAISFYVTDTTDLVVDIDGYFAPASSSTLAFYPLPPCRVADTRNSNGDLGGPYLRGDMQRDFPLLEATSCFPAGVHPAAYSLNFTAVPHGRLGYLTVWPTGQNQPLVSTLNSYGGQITANAAILPAGSNGEISTYVTNDTDLVIDVDGYFAAPTQSGLSLYPVAPCRVLDTRPPGGSGAFVGTLNPPVDFRGSSCAVPSPAQAYVMNATVVPEGRLGYLTLWPDGGSQPVVSTLNALDGVVSSNMAIVPAGSAGKVDAYAYQNTSPTNLLLDIFSYFAP